MKQYYCQNLEVKVTMKVISVNSSVNKGTIKNPIEKGSFIKDHGLEGDAHSGNHHRQVSLLAVESYKKVDMDLKIGSFAENITTEGIVLHTLPIGTILEINDCILEVTQIGKKCHLGCEIKTLTGDCVMPKEGIFCKVIKSGIINVDDTIRLKG